MQKEIYEETSDNEKIKSELTDVLVCVLEIANLYDINLESEFNKKIQSLEDYLAKPYTTVTIELKDNYNLNEIKELLSNKGDTEINLIIKAKNKKAFYSLQENRKFDLNHLKVLKGKKYVEKITV